MGWLGVFWVVQRSWGDVCSVTITCVALCRQGAAPTSCTPELWAAWEGPTAGP